MDQGINDIEKKYREFSEEPNIKIEEQKNASCTTILIIIGVLAIAAAAIALGVVFGIKESKKKQFLEVKLKSIQLEPNIIIESAHYTSNGEILFTYKNKSISDNESETIYSFGIVDDDGNNFRHIFTGNVASLYDYPSELRQLPFQDNSRVLLGDLILECSENSKLSDCKSPKIIPILFPEKVLNISTIFRVWSEPIIAPDNVHYAWTTLDIIKGSINFISRLNKHSNQSDLEECKNIPDFEERGFDSCYTLSNVSIISNFFTDGEYDNETKIFKPQPIRGGELKQFVKGGLAITQAGSNGIGLSRATLQYLNDTIVHELNHEPGYEETAILSPDEKLGISMSARFSNKTNFGILGLLPIPYSSSILAPIIKNIYFFSVRDVRQTGKGDIGPVLFIIEDSINNGYTKGNYRGQSLHEEEGWNFVSPISWHYTSRKACFLETNPEEERRIRIAYLKDYKESAKVRDKETPDDISYAYDLDKLDENMPFVFDFIIPSNITEVQYSNITWKQDISESSMVYNNFTNDGEYFFNGILKNTVYDDLISASVEFDISMTDKSGKEVGRSEFKLKFNGESSIDWDFSKGSATYKNITINMDIYKPE